MNGNASALDKISNLLALLLTKDESRMATAATLSACGFTNREIAALIGSSEGSVRSMISQGRKKQGADA